MCTESEKGEICAFDKICGDVRNDVEAKSAQRQPVVKFHNAGDAELHPSRR